MFIGLIYATTELIQECDGDISKITLRRISERANVGLGLINYHFGSKESELTDKERLTAWAKQVYDFLFHNYAISSISILGDMQNYHSKCNSVYTQKGFLKAIKNDIGEDAKKILVFMLTSAMQVAFLSADSSKEILGYNLKVKEECHWRMFPEQNMKQKMAYIGRKSAVRT